MYILISTAVSMDGCMDSTTEEPITLSNDEDWKEVDDLRCEYDAIFVGANTIRRDDPSLRIHDQEVLERREKEGNPLLRVTVTRTGNIDNTLRFFRDDNYVLYCPKENISEVSKKFKNASGYDSNDTVSSIVKDLESRGVKTLMVEGGSKIINLFLQSGLVNEIRLAISSLLVGGETSPRFRYDGITNSDFKLESVRKLDDIVVLNYKNSKL